MKNNIIKDDREISMKTASFPTGIYEDPESITTDNNLSTETCEMNTNTLADLSEPTEPMTIADEPIADPAVAWQSTQTELTALFEQAKSTTTEFFKNNQQLFMTLGWIVLAIIGDKLVFAALGTIDDIPLVTPILKLVGLVSVVRFAWRYLIREHDRQELIEIIDRTKVEVLGDRQPLS
jgi:CAAD domains of cyanobacterial aminoacyl-tRNA synthetase